MCVWYALTTKKLGYSQTSLTATLVRLKYDPSIKPLERVTRLLPEHRYSDGEVASTLADNSRLSRNLVV